MKNLAFKIIFIISLILILAGLARAEPWEFNLRNDFVMPGGMDRFLSNAFYFKRGDWTIGNDMYTPRDKRSTEVDTGDRPWDGYTYLEKLDVEKLAFGQERLIRARIGAVGMLQGARIFSDLFMRI